MNKDIFITKSDGTKEKFDVEKLRRSLLKAGTPNKVVGEIIEHVSSELSDGMTTKEIYRHAFQMLNTEDQPIAIRYSLKRAVMELGPSGFPFEKYVAEIFKAQDMDAVTGQLVKGFCTEHEVDVVAWNEKKMIMVEAKFHNDGAIKSDLKVILYVKARFDDLHKMKFNFGGKERDLSEAWLVTNTKFSKAAIEYGSCQGGVVMIGWNYPPKGNLHDMLIEYKLHPLTCLTTLNGMQKNALLEQGIVLAKDLLNNPAALVMAGVEKEGIAEVEAEINML
jgi:ATP cone domain/Restriction endonuclease